MIANPLIGMPPLSSGFRFPNIRAINSLVTYLLLLCKINPPEPLKVFEEVVLRHYPSKYPQTNSAEVVIGNYRSQVRVVGIGAWDRENLLPP